MARRQHVKERTTSIRNGSKNDPARIGGTLADAIRFIAYIEGVPLTAIYERALRREAAAATYSDAQLNAFFGARKKAVQAILDGRELDIAA